MIKVFANKGGKKYFIIFIDDCKKYEAFTGYASNSSLYRILVHKLEILGVQKATIIKSRNATFFWGHLFL